MFSQKTLAPVDNLFDQGYKLSYFCEGLSKYEENHLKSFERNDKVFKSSVVHKVKLLYCAGCIINL
jgi:predicted  nucleic acid-binding Zn-ribbon protein